MPIGLPVKANYAAGDILTAVNMNDLSGTFNSVATSYGQAAGKNLLINGGMDFWQRSTSSAGNASYFTADRWLQIASGTTTHSQDTDVPTGVSVRYSIRWVTSASSSFGQWYQMIEQANVIPLRGQTLTASAYFKTSGTAYTGNLILRIDYNTTSDTFAGGSWIGLSDTVFAGSSVTSWTRRSGTFTVPSNAVGLRFSLVPDSVQASGVTVKMAGAQIEAGNLVTPFSRAGGLIGGELALCQRYYFRSRADAPFSFLGNTGYANTTSSVYIPFVLPVRLRAYPTALDFGGQLSISDSQSRVKGGTWTILSAGTVDSPVISYLHGSALFTQFRSYGLQADNDANTFVGFSAEL